MNVLSFEGLTVNELKEMLREAELPISGTKAQLIERLQANHPETNTISLDSEKTLVDDAILAGEESVPWYRGTEVLTPPALIAIGVAVLMVTAIFVIQPTWLGFEPDYEYELISYDAAQAKNYAETLVSYGHPEWDGRMSGTVQEANTSEYIISQFDCHGHGDDPALLSGPDASCEFGAKSPNLRSWRPWWDKPMRGTYEWFI